MRICEKHRERAVETLVSRQDGTEYDLCTVCQAELVEILKERPKEEVKRGRKRISSNS